MMSTRVLMLLTVILGVLMGYWYQQNDENLIANPLSIGDIDYQATQINALQTDETGAVQYQLSADSIKHYQNPKMAVLNHIHLHWQPDLYHEVNFFADQAKFDEVQQQIDFMGKVKLIRQPMKSSGDTHHVSQIEVLGNHFVGNLSQKYVYSRQPIAVLQDNQRFDAKQFYANLATGEYQFDGVSMLFLPQN